MRRAEGFLFPSLKKLDYHFIDFDMPDEEHSQRYIHVQQSFIECDENLDLTEQRLGYMRDTFFPQSDLSAGKCLTLNYTIDAVDIIDYHINAELKLWRSRSIHLEVEEILS